MNLALLEGARLRFAGAMRRPPTRLPGPRFPRRPRARRGRPRAGRPSHPGARGAEAALEAR